MPTQTIETYQNGVVVDTRTVEVPQEYVNQSEVLAQLAPAMAGLAANTTRLTQIVNAASFTAVQRDQAIKDIAAAVRLNGQVLRRLIRHTVNDFSGSD